MSTEELLKWKERIEYTTEINNQLVEYSKNLKTAFEELTSQSTRLTTNISKKVTDWETVCSKILSTKSQLKKSNEELRKPDNDIKNKISLLKQQIVEKRSALKNVTTKDKELDEKINEKLKKMQEADLEIVKLQQLVCDKRKALEDLQDKIRIIKENEKIYEANMKAVEALELIR